MLSPPGMEFVTSLFGVGGGNYVSVLFSWTFEPMTGWRCRHKVLLFGEFAPQFGYMARKSPSILDRREGK